MKHLLTLLAIAALSLSYAQNFHESTYVHEGRAFQFVVPNPFEEFVMGDPEMSLYCRDLNLAEQGEFTDALVIGNVRNKKNQDLDALMADAEFDIMKDVKDPILNTYINRSGQEFRTIKGKVDFIGDSPSDGYIAITLFHEVIVVVGLFDIEDSEETDPSLLTAMLESYSEYETDRENAFIPREELDDYLDDEEDDNFLNSEYATELDYAFINLFPKPGMKGETPFFWDEDWTTLYPELLTAFGCYDMSAEEQVAPICGVKVFSGGNAINYKSDLNKLVALQKVFDMHYIEGIAAKETVAGDMFNFQKYKVTSSAFEFAQHVLYSTEILGETIFVLGYFREVPTETLEAELEQVVKTLKYEY